tara:strand:+ start:9462 stop:9680 length:219 start_codon:yes stop_codon:yes gene_type:complete
MQNVYQCYADDPKWFKISKKRFLELTEGRGAYEKGTALKTLEDCGTIRTEFSFFKSETDYLMDLAESKGIFK